MAVGVEPQTMPKARLTRKVLFGHALEVVDEQAVGFIQLPLDIGERLVSFLFRHRGGLPSVRISGKYFNASSSQVVTCARISLTDQLSMTPATINCGFDKPTYDSWNVAHAFSSRFRA